MPWRPQRVRGISSMFRVITSKHVISLSDSRWKAFNSVSGVASCLFDSLCIWHTLNHTWTMTLMLLICALKQTWRNSLRVRRNSKTPSHQTPTFWLSKQERAGLLMGNSCLFTFGNCAWFHIYFIFMWMRLFWWFRGPEALRGTRDQMENKVTRYFLK